MSELKKCIRFKIGGGKRKKKRKEGHFLYLARKLFTTGLSRLILPALQWQSNSWQPFDKQPMMRIVWIQCRSQRPIRVAMAIQLGRLPFRMAIDLDSSSIVQPFRWSMDVAVDGVLQDDLWPHSNRCAHQSPMVASAVVLSQIESGSVGHSMCCRWSPDASVPMCMWCVPTIASIHGSLFGCANRKSNANGIHKWNDSLKKDKELWNN